MLNQTLNADSVDSKIGYLINTLIQDIKLVQVHSDEQLVREIYADFELSLNRLSNEFERSRLNQKDLTSIRITNLNIQSYIDTLTQNECIAAVQMVKDVLSSH